MGRPSTFDIFCGLTACWRGRGGLLRKCVNGKVKDAGGGCRKILVLSITESKKAEFSEETPAM
jgi:hypothetical protein